MYNKTWRYKYYWFRSCLSNWLDGIFTRYYRTHKKSEIAIRLYERFDGGSSVWFCKISGLICEIHGMQRGNFYIIGLSEEEQKVSMDRLMKDGGGWY